MWWVRNFSAYLYCTRCSHKSVAGQPFAKEIECVTNGYNQSSQQKPGIETGYPGRICRGPSCLMAWNLWIAQETNKVFENVVPAQTLPASTRRDKDSRKWRKAVGLPQMYRQGTSQWRHSAANTWYPSGKRQNDSKGSPEVATAVRASMGPENRASSLCRLFSGPET